MKKNKFFFISFTVLVLFFMLMIYALNKDPNALPSQLVNKPARPFVASVVQGGKFDLSDNIGKGRWVVINFWTSSCIVCREEAPEFERFFQESKTEGAPLFVSVNIQDKPEYILQWQVDYKQSFPVVSDRNGRISLDYGVTGTPETFFINPQGIVRHRVAGGVDKDSILRFIDWLEKNPSVTPEEALQGFAQMRAT